MGGKGSGNRSAKGVPYDKNPLWQAQDPKNVDKGTNHASIVFGMALFDLVREEVDLADPEAVERRFLDFLRCCDEAEIRPMMTGLAIAMNITPSQLSRVGQGDESTLKRRLTPESRKVLKKAYQFMRLSWEINLQTEKGNPVKWLFLGKNYYGMRDQTEQVVMHVDEAAALPSALETAAKYAALVGRDEPRALEAEVIDVEDVTQSDSRETPGT